MMERIMESEYYVVTDVRHWEKILYYWKDAIAGEERPNPVEINRYPMDTTTHDMYASVSAHQEHLAEEERKKGLEEEREGLTKVVAYLNPMQLKVLKAMDAKIEEED